MKILAIYDSYFGNTEKIGQAIGTALSKDHEVKTLRVTDVKVEEVKGLDLLIAGSPTRGFQPTEKIKQFIKSIPNQDLKNIKVAAFDTGIAPADIKIPVLRWIVKVGGYAAKPIAKLLVKKGGKLIVPPEGFLVLGEKGPLKSGELERAGQWAGKIR